MAILDLPRKRGRVRTTNDRALLVIGCGNETAGDDAAGVEAVRRLRRRPARGCQFEEAGLDMLRLLDAMSGAASVIFIDAVSSDRPPGTLHLLHLPSASISPRNLNSVSTHGWDLQAVLELASHLGRRLPPLALIGIEAGSVRKGVVAPPVDSAVDFVVDNFDALRVCLLSLEPKEHSVQLAPPSYALPECVAIEW